MGHWDTKSQTFSSIIRIILLVTMLFGILIITGIYFIICILMIFFDYQNELLLHVLLILAIVIIIPSVLNSFNKTENKSPGALDNAVSVAVVLELARIYKNAPLNNYDLIFLTPGSEELNLGGAISFINKHFKEFDP
jgi:hypothetical protein